MLSTCRTSACSRSRPSTRCSTSQPVGEHLVQVCTTTPCWLRGSDDVVAACKKHIAPRQHTVSADGKFSWMEVECLGACVNAPMLQIGKDFYEDLDGPKTEALLEAFRRGKTPKPGAGNGRHTSEPAGGALTLTDPQLYQRRLQPQTGSAPDARRQGPHLHQPLRLRGLGPRRRAKTRGAWDGTKDILALGPEAHHRRR